MIENELFEKINKLSPTQINKLPTMQVSEENNSFQLSFDKPAESQRHLDNLFEKTYGNRTKISPGVFNQFTAYQCDNDSFLLLQPACTRTVYGPEATGILIYKFANKEDMKTFISKSVTYLQTHSADTTEAIANIDRISPTNHDKSIMENIFKIRDSFVEKTTGHEFKIK
jgi:hypothetical protein